MQKSTNYELNLPDLADQFNLNHWNENTEKLDLELKKETDSRINTDNQLQSNINNSVSTLRNEISTAETNAKNLANATGVLAVAKGGTGENNAKDASNMLLNALDTAEGTPVDDDYYISQYANGGTTYPLYYRRKTIALWNYIKSKISSVLGLTANQYNGNATTATTATNAYNAYKGMVHTCSTAVGTVAKTVSVTGFTLTTGACIRVLFANGNNVASPTLNVNNTGAKEIVVPNVSNGGVKTLSSDYGSLTTGAYYWRQNTVLELYYNGSYWVVMNDPIVAEYTHDDYEHGELHIGGKKKIWGELPPATSETTVTFAYTFESSHTYSLVTGAYKSSHADIGGVLIKSKTSDSFKYTTTSAGGTDGNTSGYFIAEGY
jgi:hypothetical protein